MAVGINHAWHQNAASGVDLHRALRHSELASDGLNAFVHDENIAMLDCSKRWVNRQHSGVAEYHRAAWCEGITVCCWDLAHAAHLFVFWPQNARRATPPDAGRLAALPAS